MVAKKILVGVVSVLLLAAGCSNNGETEKEEDKEFEQQQEQSQKSEDTINGNEELTQRIKGEEGVIDVEIYEQDGAVVGKLVLDQKVSGQNVKEILEGYAKKIQTEYQGKKVNVQALRNGKVAEEVTLATTNENSTSTVKEGVSVQSLIDKGALSFKENITKQISVLIDSTKLTGDLAGKTASELQLVVGTETFNFNVNPFAEEQFEVQNTNYTETELRSGVIRVK